MWLFRYISLLKISYHTFKEQCNNFMTIVATSHMSVIYQWTATVNHFPATCMILWVNEELGRSNSSSSRIPRYRTSACCRVERELDSTLSVNRETRCGNIVRWDLSYTKYRSWIKSDAEIARTHPANMILLSVWRLIHLGLNSKRCGRNIAVYKSRAND